MEQILSMIESLGFPIVLSMYLLLRFEKKIDSLNATIMQLNESIKEIKKIK